MAKEDLIPIKTTERAKELGAKGGRAKKGSVHLSTRIKNMLDDPDFEVKLKDGSIMKGQPIEAIMKVAIARAMSGDIRFLEWLAKYGYGQKLDVSIGNNLFNTDKLVVEVIKNDENKTKRETENSS